MLYMLSAYSHLEKAGHTVFILCHDNYSNRHEFCYRNNIDLHIQCHLNAGKGNYGLILYRDLAKDLAEIMGERLKKKLKLPNVKAQKLLSSTRGYACTLDSIPSLLLEPMFLDNDDHYNQIVRGDALFIIGKVVAESIIEWDKGGEKK